MRIPPELTEFLESGLAIVVATRDAALQPDVAMACAVRVQDERLLLFLPEQAAREMLRNLEAHPAIAIDFDRPTSHRACQVKGVYLGSRRARAAERALVERQVEAFAGDLEAIGIPPAVSGSAARWPCTALDIRVTQVFEQTPGPGTGEPLA